MKKQRTAGSVFLVIFTWYAIIAGIVAVGAFVLGNFFLCSGFLSTCGNPFANIILGLIVGLAWPVVLPLYLWTWGHA